MSKEGITVRGAPGLRVFRALRGGAVISNYSEERREALILEAVELIRKELLQVVGQKPVKLPEHVLNNSGDFVATLLQHVENRSAGRVEQALVGAKLQIRFPRKTIEVNPTFAGDQQTNRECDFTVDNLRVIVSATPNDGHYQSAMALADRGREVFLVVGERSYDRARKRIRETGYSGTVRVATIQDYVAGNMTEIGNEQGVPAREMCLKLVAEYNTRIAADYDSSLQVAPENLAQAEPESDA
jgi:hypothetical protein